jgi:hypothetical protein
MVSRKKKHPGGRPPKPQEERLGAQISLRTDEDTAARLEKLIQRYGRIAQRGVVVRAVLELGLDIVEANPTILLFATPEERAERFLQQHWLEGGMFGGAERDPKTGEFVVYLLPAAARSVGATTADMAEHEGRSKESYWAALTDLASKFPPRKPLPWTT